MNLNFKDDYNEDFKSIIAYNSNIIVKKKELS